MSTAKEFAENAENNIEIEQQFAVKAVHHLQTYQRLITSVKGSKLRLTKKDDEIYEDFRNEFPGLQVDCLNELEDFKSEAAKTKWREFIMRYEHQVPDYNFGTLLRIRAAEEASEENTMFCTRMQFYAIEIARNKLGLNDVLCP